MGKLRDLMEHRNSILLAEVGALIHDLGKLSEEFVKQMCRNGGAYKDSFSHELILGRSFIFLHDQDVVPIKGNLSLKLAEIKKLAAAIKNPKDKNEVIKAGNILGISLSRAQAEALEEIIKEKYSSQTAKINENIVKILNELKFESNNEELRLADLIACHGDSDVYWNYDKKSDWLLKLFKRDADGIDSGIDKGATVNANKQVTSHTYISTSFGYEFERIDADSSQLRQHREKFIQKLEGILEKIQKVSSKNGTALPRKWVNLRNDLLKFAEEHFVHALGETRRSANDVRLWDHSHSTASLYKSALADIILSGQRGDPNVVRWRLLSIRFNGFDYITKSSKVGDILGRRGRVELALDLVKCLLEVYIPLGNEIYRDENGSVFLIPENFKEDVLSKGVIEDDGIPILEARNEQAIRIESTDTVKSAIKKIFNEVTFSELKPTIEVSEDSRGAANLGKELGKHRVLFNMPFIDDIKRKWGAVSAPVCKVCGLKPCEKENTGYSDLCTDCKKVRESQSKTWYGERVRHKSTIWIDEVCDEYGRVGVIVGAFNLDNWLNGMWLNTCFTKTIEDLKRQKPEVFHEIYSWDVLVDAIKESLDKNKPESDLSFKKPDGNNIKVRELFALLADFYKSNNEIKSFFGAVVRNREEDVIKWAYYDKGTNVDDLPNDQKARLLFLALFRKNPSFARIRRIWETTKGFWDQMESIIKERFDKKKRIKLTFKIYPGIALSKFMAYVLKIGGVSIPVLYVGNGDFLIIETQDVLNASGVNEKFLEENIKEGKFEIWQPSEYREKSIRLYPQPNVERPEFMGITEDSEYYPYITLLKAPTLFIALVPLQRTLDIIKLIKREYEIQFSKVQNRLPIKLGLIAFKRKYPLYVVLDAVKRFLNEEIKEKTFEIKRLDLFSAGDNCNKFDGRLGNYAKIIELSRNHEKFTVHVSYSTGDPNIEDVFYPYFMVCGNSDLCTLIYKDYSKEICKECSKKFCINNLVKIKHVSKLSKGEEVFFEPSVFDFVFLDSNIRRFDVGSIRKHWLFTESKNMPKPYLLWDFDNFEKLKELLIDRLELTTTQIMNLHELLISKIEDWGLKDVEKLRSDKTFETFVDNAIKNVPLRLEITDGEESSEGRITKRDFEFLKESILNGMFFDFVDLWHTILKKKFRKGDEKSV